MANLLNPGDDGWPVAWMTLGRGALTDEAARDLRAHGVGLVSAEAKTAAEAARALAWARRHGMKLHFSIPEVTERADLVAEAGVEPERAVMIGGAYRGLAVDRHLFDFAPERHEIVVEPPVYNSRFAYRTGSSDPGSGGDPVGHYYPDMGPPSRAEVVVPLAPFDGRQHLRIMSADVSEAPEGAVPERDTVAGDMPRSSETASRRLWRVSFDLTGLDGAMLDRVGVALHWEYRGTRKYWIFGRGTASARAESAREALRRLVREAARPWIEANGGEFPSETVAAARFGDECFWVTGHSWHEAVSFPLWDCSESAVAEFRRRAGGIEHPRTWGFPEVYGREAYALWQYLAHESCAELCRVAREELREVAPGVMLFRNTTRMGVFDLSNDHDGTGQELLARELDVVHLDPYPVRGTGYSPEIPRDMSYCAGLARRLGKPLVPWMQAHTYGGPSGLQHPTPGEVDRMCAEQYAQGVDAAMWLGYGSRYTFPSTEAGSWERAGEFHKRLAASPPPKPVARLAVLRFYGAWSVSSAERSLVRNPADWLMQRALEVWAVRRGLAYDVFEVPPRPSDGERAALARELERYDFVLANEPADFCPRAWAVGDGTEGTTLDPATAPAVEAALEDEMRERGWFDRRDSEARDPAKGE